MATAATILNGATMALKGDDGTVSIRGVGNAVEELAKRVSVITTMSRPRVASAPASAWAGNKCPPVPPAERTMTLMPAPQKSWDRHEWSYGFAAAGVSPPAQNPWSAPPRK